MNIENQIAALLAEAEPLRSLPEQEQDALGAIVNRINALRAVQAAAGYALGAAVDAKHDAEVRQVIESVAAPKRGRPRKVE